MILTLVKTEVQLLKKNLVINVFLNVQKKMENIMMIKVMKQTKQHLLKYVKNLFVQKQMIHSLVKMEMKLLKKNLMKNVYLNVMKKMVSIMIIQEKK